MGLCLPCESPGVPNICASCGSSGREQAKQTHGPAHGLTYQYLFYLEPRILWLLILTQIVKFSLSFLFGHLSCDFSFQQQNVSICKILRMVVVSNMFLVKRIRLAVVLQFRECPVQELCGLEARHAHSRARGQRRSTRAADTADQSFSASALLAFWARWLFVVGLSSTL